MEFAVENLELLAYRCHHLNDMDMIVQAQILKANGNRLFRTSRHISASSDEVKVSCTCCNYLKYE